MSVTLVLPVGGSVVPGLMGEFGRSSVGGPGASEAVYSELVQGAPMNGE